MSALHLSPEILDGPELQLLYRALAAAELAGNLADAFLFHEAHVNHSELRFRKPLHELEQYGAALDFRETGAVGVERRISRFPPSALPVVGDCAGGDPQEPRDERNAAPFELANP